MDRCSHCHGQYQYGMESEDCMLISGLCLVCDWLERKREEGGINPELSKVTKEE